MTEPPNKILPVDTSRLQLELSQKFLSNSTFESLYRSNNVSTFGENTSEMMSRRLKLHRHPLSGISSLLPEMTASPAADPDILLKEIKSNSKLNARILETWLNNTITDAAILNLPEQVIKQDLKVPLVRFGIDRTALLNAGLPSSDVDRIYRSLFVYSIGFFQLIRRILEHTKNKYTIVTGIWKAYAILLEYCCQFDYDMIITTLNLEKKEELTHLENDYKEQVLKMEDHQRQLLDNINLSRLQLQNIQKDLMDEIRKREELEDELLQRGSGHEEEVTMRLQFESKLNQMYAKIRDMESKIKIVNDSLEELNQTLEHRTESLQNERKKNLVLVQYKLETEQEIKKTIEKYKQVETINGSLEQRLADCYNKIDELNLTLSNAHTQNNQILNDLAHKKIEIEDLKFTMDIIKGHIGKLNLLVDELKVEKEVHLKRIQSLEDTLNQETEKHKHFQQEYVKMKEHDTVKSVDLDKYKRRAEDQESILINLEKERDSLKVRRDSLEGMITEIRDQFKQSQERLEEMNKGRRIVEEQNEILKSRLADREKELHEDRVIIHGLKEEQEKFKNNEVNITSQMATVQIKLQTVEKQFEATRSTLQEKVSNLTDILESEKAVRQNWIYRYEEEHKVHTNVTRELLNTQDRLNEMTIKNNSLKAQMEEMELLLQKYSEKSKQEMEENMELRASNEDLKRKVKTNQILLERVDEDYKERMEECEKDTEKLKQVVNEKINTYLMQVEDIWQQAKNSYEKYEGMVKDHERVRDLQENLDNIVGAAKSELSEQTILADQRGMIIEELREMIINLDIIATNHKNNRKITEFELRKIQIDFHEYKNQCPEELRKEPNPFKIMAKQIASLRGELNFIESSKPVLADFQMQWEAPIDNWDRAIQTDEYLDLDQSIQRENSLTSSLAENPDDSIYVKKKTESLDLTSKKSTEKPKQILRDKIYREKAVKEKATKEKLNKDSSLIQNEDYNTPINMRSIYNNESTVETQEVPSYSPRFPAINRKSSQPNSMVHLPQPIPTAGDFKRFLKQAVSRRKNDKTLA